MYIYVVYCMYILCLTGEIRFNVCSFCTSRILRPCSTFIPIRKKWFRIMRGLHEHILHLQQEHTVGVLIFPTSFV